ncbi:nucleotidyltransferase family protein [Haloarcula salinisoli]|uniref:Nucleotidyltransferase family protein n=1 Tax=Haloarcula salinisoli TaxID=2487746 RepID=A0A8J7YPM2_9EURY|nr:nucleotidyltransferase family protein [Halomicroarcula salinisoli]MBX0305601.1 nucleotidyltransferase family protein [Halomicroarcula salinisoli]
MSFHNRSDALIELLDELSKEGLEYVLVGGYAVSAFNARFSTDLDIVVAPDSKSKFVEFLEQRDFEKTDSHAKEWFYDTEVIEYEKRLTPQQPIGFDLLVNGLGCRQTEAQWSFDYLYDHSQQQEVSGGTVTTTARVIDGAVLVAAKLHSGRETDLRDVLAVAEEIALDSVTAHLRRGDEDALREQLERGLEILGSEELKHGYRSDFGASAVSAETVSSLQEYLSSQVDQLS